MRDRHISTQHGRCARPIYRDAAASVGRQVATQRTIKGLSCSSSSRLRDLCMLGCQLHAVWRSLGCSPASQLGEQPPHPGTRAYSASSAGSGSKSAPWLPDGQTVAPAWHLQWQTKGSGTGRVCCACANMSWVVSRALATRWAHSCSQHQVLCFACTLPAWAAHGHPGSRRCHCLTSVDGASTCCCSFTTGVPPRVALRAAACIVLRAGSLWQFPNLTSPTIVRTHVRRVNLAGSPVTGSAAPIMAALGATVACARNILMQV